MQFKTVFVSCNSVSGDRKNSEREFIAHGPGVVWRCGVAVEYRTCDREVAGSSLCRAPRRKNSGQVSHTYVPLSPSSTTWYRSKGGCPATGEYRHYGPCGVAGKNCVIPLLHVGLVWLLVAVLRGSLSVVIAALRGRCILCILCKVERICLNYIKGKDYY